MNKPDVLTRWTVEQSIELYGIRTWGGGYFDVSPEGAVLVKPDGPGGPASISLPEVVSGLRERGFGLPVLLRFADLLDSRLRMIHESFARAIEQAGYRGAYRGVYPIKVNQQQQVVEEITRRGRRFHHGLEAGSKAELIAALAYLDDPGALIVCNGYKDEEFVDLALYSLKMGQPTLLVLEMPEELAMVLERARRLDVRPALGVRFKIAARAGGHWTESGGDRSMFGLTASQVIDLRDRLAELDLLDCLQMLHYHIGSQVPNIRDIQAGIREAAHVYVDLAREGAAMGYLNVGGGLAVDYDGSHTNFASSSNYSVDEYAADIVEAVKGVCDTSEVPHPVLVSESGRAVVAHHSILVFNVLGVTRFQDRAPPREAAADAPKCIRDLLDVYGAVNLKNLQECYHDAVFFRDEARTLFEHGVVNLRTRALAETVFWNTVSRIADELKKQKQVPEELQGIETALADVYYGNFSIFQSLPDTWAIEQIFPVMPIHRLDECPTRAGTIADITCDCDGKIDRFVDLQDVRRTLRMHEINGSDYYLGVFLVGAYQETLGDLHNLFGDTNVVNVTLGADGQLDYTYEYEGDSVADVLSYVEYHPAELVERLRMKAERAVRGGKITAQHRREIMDAYQNGLRGYTYFEP